MSDLFNRALERLSRVPGVNGALIVDARAGVPVVGEVSGGSSPDALAALAASLYRRARKAIDSTGMGVVGALQLEAEQGNVVVADAGEMLIVTLAAHDAQLGLIRLETRRAAESLQ